MVQKYVELRKERDRHTQGYSTENMHRGSESTQQKGHKMTYGIVRSGRPGKHTLGRAFCNNFESRVVMESLPDQ